MPPAWPDSATFWHDKRVIVTDGSGLIGGGDRLKLIAYPPGFDRRTLWNPTL